MFGIVDWDGNTTSTERIKVLAEGSRNGIENLLFDPLLICLLMMKYRRAPSSVADISGFVRAATLDRTQLQRLVDSVQNEVFPDATGPKREVRYLWGATASVLIEYLTIDDHELEKKLVANFPCLNRNTGTGKLLNAVVDEVLTEHTGFCPEEFRTLFQTIANAPE